VEQLNQIDDSTSINISDTARQFFIRFAESEGKSFFAVDNDTKLVYLRVKVLAGGCSGFQYCLELEDNTKDWNPMTENILVSNGISMIVDSKSRQLLGGLIIDYKDGLMESGLTFTNPSATATCGCGTSFR
jgi:iron-sulfur cluster assembly accessory protein